MKIGILSSGHLGLKTCQAIVEEGYLPTFVFTDKGSGSIQDFCRAAEIPCFTGNPRNGKGSNFIASLGASIDLILSINYLFLIEEDLIRISSRGCVNFHGSILPRYRGRTPHVWSIINNESETGISAHFIDRGCDTGQIIYQEVIPISSTHTGADLLGIYAEKYPGVVLSVIDLFSNGSVSSFPQDETKATYFPKRTPEDGRINWDWQKERIYNWVRAQAAPYPGAFTFINKEKVVIDWITFSDRGFRFEQPNGLVLKGGKNAEIKTSNGVIKITKQRSEIDLTEGDILM
jgi:methionyl-tRNA formyltransferase